MIMIIKVSKISTFIAIATAILSCGCEKKSVATVETITVTDITVSTAVSSGIVNSDGGATVSARGSCWSTNQNPTIYDFTTTDGTGSGNFTSTLTMLTPNMTYYVRAYATNSAGTAYGNEISFKTYGVSDVDGNMYYTIQIGEQTWLAENLKTTKYNDGTNIPNVTDATAWIKLTTPGYCWYQNNEATKNTYGAFYNWYAVNTGNLCPSGWHVPTEEEWTIMENYLIANGYNYDGTTSGNKIAKSLASNTGWWSSTITGAVGNIDYPEMRNKTGFTAIASGGRYTIDGDFWAASMIGYWWSATEKPFPYIETPVNLTIRSDLSYLSWGTNKKGNGFSIRCVSGGLDKGE